MHYYQRPDATHLTVDDNATSLSGYGGSIRLGRSGKGRFGVTDHLLWYSPGLDFNEVGYLKQADILANQVFLSWSEPAPKGPFREYSFELSRRDSWDFGGLATEGVTSAHASGQFRNKWRVSSALAHFEIVDTRALRGGPALRASDFWALVGSLATDSSRRIAASVEDEYDWALEGSSRSNRVTAQLSLRPSNRLSISAAGEYNWLDDDLQYVTTSDTTDGPRWVLGRINQDTWSLTVRVNLAITPDLTLQYYGSPFVGTGQYSALRKATDSLAPVYEDRFHVYGPQEIAYSAERNAYDVTEEDGGPRYSFGNPDFSFRQFRSNLVARWEYRPGSALYVVWSQGRTSNEPYWEDTFHTNWRSLWSAPADNVFLVKLSYWFSP